LSTRHKHNLPDLSIYVNWLIRLEVPRQNEAIP
jgi:hypothetical protein